MLAFAGGVLDVLVPPAHAQQADINVNTPAIRSLRSSMKARRPQLDPHFRTGAVGLTRDGLISARDLNAVPLKDRNKVKKLLADDNRDRNALYKEIAKANGRPEWERDIRETFARVWVDESPRGTWYQDRSGGWKQK